MEKELKYSAIFFAIILIPTWIFAGFYWVVALLIAASASYAIKNIAMDTCQPHVVGYHQRKKHPITLIVVISCIFTIMLLLGDINLALFYLTIPISEYFAGNKGYKNEQLIQRND